MNKSRQLFFIVCSILMGWVVSLPHLLGNPLLTRPVPSIETISLISGATIAATARSSGGLIDDIEDLPPAKSSEQPEKTSPPSSKESATPARPPANSPSTPQKAPSTQPSTPSNSNGKRIRTKPEDSGASSKEPVHVRSQGMRATRDGGTAELEKDVVITQGQLQLESDYAKVYFHIDTNEVEKVHAQNNVKVTKESELPEDRIVAKGNEALFLNDERKVILKGNARLWRGGDLIKGTQITYDMETGWITVDRVEGVMQPGKGI